MEEQFYLIWPVVVLLVLRRHRGKRGRRMLRTVALIGALLSAAWMAFLAARHGFPVPNDPSRDYYGTDTHASGLMLGSALACIWPLGALPRLTRNERYALDVAGGAAVLWLLWIFHSASEFSYWLYRGGFLFYSAVAVVAVAAIAHPECRLGRVMAVQPIRWIGERSYGIYLWHWPIFMLTRPTLDIGVTGTGNLILRLTLTAMAAELSWRLLEQPVRHGALGRMLAAWRALRERRAERQPAHAGPQFREFPGGLGPGAVLPGRRPAVPPRRRRASTRRRLPPARRRRARAPSPSGTLARKVGAATLPTAPTAAPTTHPSASTHVPPAGHTQAPPRESR